MNDKNVEFLKEETTIKQLISDDIPQINLSDVMETCEVASKYLPAAKTNRLFDLTFWKVVFIAFWSKSVFFWLASAFVLASCTLLPRIIDTGNNSVFIYLSTIAPVTFVAFAIGEIHNRDKRLIEVEKTCRYTPEHIFIARLSVCMLINAVILLVSGQIMHEFYSDIMRMYLCAFIGAITVWVMSFLDNALPLSVMLATWVTIGFYLTESEELIYWLENITYIPIIITLCLSLSLFVFSTIQTTKKIYD